MASVTNAFVPIPMDAGGRLATVTVMKFKFVIIRVFAITVFEYTTFDEMVLLVRMLPLASISNLVLPSTLNLSNLEFVFAPYPIVDMDIAIPL